MGVSGLTGGDAITAQRYYHYKAVGRVKYPQKKHYGTLYLGMWQKIKTHQNAMCVVIGKSLNIHLL